ncbi:MAG: hypothetical protein HQ542_11115 [Bacteroidia bacterium]|nr:hypothetical protein [Bacteroidia bacterium]
MPSTSRSKKRRRSSSKDKGFSLRSVETLFSKQLMRVIGILFLGASLWFAANSTDTIFKIAKNLVSPNELITKQSPVSPSVTEQIIPPVQAPSSPITFPMVLILFAMLTGWLGLQLLTRWRKRAEFQIISVFLVFIALLAMIRSYGWQVELFFPLLIFIAVGLSFFGQHLSHTGTRINFLFTWGLFSLWWLLKIMINGQTDQLLSFFILASLIFLTFHLILLFKGFAGHRLLSNYMEVIAIGLNLGLYFALVSLTILKFYDKFPLFFFTFSLSVVYILSLLGMELSRKPFRKIPFLISALALLSLLLPLLFYENQVILLAGSLSVLLLFYSRQTKDQPSIIISLGLVALMILVFLKDIVFAYAPAAFMGGMTGNTSLLYKGLIAGFFISLVAFVDRRQLKDLTISYSRKWFSRRRYRMLLKIVFLVGLYSGLFWFWHYSWIAINGYEEVGLISWFSFLCLFFIVAIPWLSAQRSSILSLAILGSVIMTLVYPSLLSLQNVKLLDLYVRGVQSGLTLFPLHYVPAALFLIFIAIVLQYVGRAFKENTIAKRIFLIYAVVMILYIFISEMVLTGLFMNAESQLEVSEIRSQLLGLPTTMILFAGGLLLLIWGFFRQKRFGRTLAMILLFMAAFKLIYLDLKTISLFTRVILLFATGSVFIGLSLGYTRTRRAFRKKRASESRSRKPRFPQQEPTLNQDTEL